MPPGTGRVSEDVDEEVRFHLERKIERLMREGMSEDQARTEASRRFGDVDRVKARMTREREVGMERRARWDDLRQDVQYALRQTIKNPGFTAVTVLTLALGIGATTAIFSVVDGILFRPLPFPQPEQLVAVWTDLSRRGGPVDEWMNYDNYADLEERSRTLQAVAAWGGGAPTVTGHGDPEQIVAGFVTQSMFSEVLRVPPALGRGFAPEDDRADAPGTVLLTDGFWRRVLGGDPAVLGSGLTLNDEPYTIIGVLPSDFVSPFVSDADVWMPMREDPSDPSCPRGNACIRVVGRIADGTTLEAARIEADDIALQLAAEYPQTNADDGILLRPLQEDMVGDAQAGLLVLMGAVGFVLLIACVNVANLLLARATTRSSEFAVRSALGAGRKRLSAQLLTESAVLALLGGGAGLLLAWVGTDLLVSIAPPGTPRVDGVSVNGRVLAFALGATVCAGVLFGIVPSLRGTGGDLDSVLREGGRGGAGGMRGMRARGALVSGQVALALMLLAGAGLLARSLQNLRATDLGYRPEGVLTLQVGLPSARYADADGLRTFVQGLDERLGALPGVSAQGATSWLPLTGAGTDLGFRIEGQAELPPGQGQAVWFRRITSGYPDAMGMRLLEGRWITRSDDERAPLVAVINEAFARRYFPDESPLGHRLNFGGAQDPEWSEIVGVAGDARYFGIRDGSRVGVYVPYPQAPSRVLRVALRSTRDASSLAVDVRAAVTELDPSLAVARIQPMETIVSDALGPERFVTLLLGLFAGVALLLAIVGLYGVVSYGVSQRLREMGVRLALGAEGGDIRGLVLGQSLRLALIGVVVGIAGALVVTRLMENLLYGVSATDPWTYGAVALILAAVATIASAVPAARAARVDPIRVLRSE
jgi:predicted permease